MHRNEVRTPARHAWFVVVCLALVLGSAATAHANPKDIPAGSRLVYSFNVIGHPEGQAYDGNCGNGHRIFVNRAANNAQVLVTNAASWGVIDCDATGDRRASLGTNQASKYDIYVRILGRPGGRINICADTFEDFQNGDMLCLLGTIDLTRGSGQSKFTIAPNAMFDASLEDLIWTVDTNANFRIAQFRVYERP